MRILANLMRLLVSVVAISLFLAACSKVEIKREFYTNGNLKSEIPCKDGNIDGVAKYYYENGNLESEIPYKDGKKDGVEKWYYESGDLAIQFNLNDDNFISGKCTNGKKLTEGDFLEWQDGTKIDKICE